MPASQHAGHSERVRGQCGLHNTLSQKYQAIKQKEWKEKGSGDRGRSDGNRILEVLGMVYLHVLDIVVGALIQTC